MKEKELSIHRLADLVRVPPTVESLELVADDWPKSPAPDALAALAQLRDLQCLSLQGFRFSPVPLLNAIPKTYVWKLSLQKIPGFDAELLRAVVRFSQLTTLVLESDFIPDTWFIALQKMPSLDALTLYTSGCMAAKGPVKRLKNLTSFEVWNPTAAHWAAWRDLGIRWGLARRVTMTGEIGDWYETGKETRAREFMPIKNSLRSPSFPLKAGDELKILDAAGSVLFSGPVCPAGDFENAWTQKNITPTLWEKWFAAHHPAELTTYISETGRQFAILPYSPKAS